MDKSRKSIYILPNLITTASLACGLLACIRATLGYFDEAILLVLACAVLDMLDGQVARLTNSVSQFGAEYDSLSDAVVFGVTPALIVYLWVTQPAAAIDFMPLWKKIGVPACIFYSIATVLRLVRFNVQSGLLEKHVFRGLPSPAAAVFLVSCLWFLLDAGYSPADFSWLIATLTIVLGILMVSPVSYYSLKGVSLKGRMPFLTLLTIVVTLCVMTFDMPLFLFLISLGYAASGPVWWGIRYARRKRHLGIKKDKSDKPDVV